MHRFSNLIKNEKGSTIVFVAMTVTVLIAFASLVIDLGGAYFETSNAQNIADAVAYSAGRQLPVDASSATALDAIRQTAKYYASKNGYTTLSDDDILLGGVSNGKYTRLTIAVTKSKPLYFAQIIGMQSVTVTRKATAAVTPVSSLDDMLPLGIEKSALQAAIQNGKTQHIVLKYGGGGGDTGFFGALDLDGVKGGGAKDFATWLAFGYDGVLHVGDVLPIESGNMAESTNTALAARYIQCTHYQSSGGCCADHYVLDCPRVVRVIVLERINNSYIRIDGFAAFVLEDIGGNGEVIGSYIDTDVVGGNYDDGGTSSDFGIYNLRLVE